MTNIYSGLYWVGNFMYSELVGEEYEDDLDFVVGIYTKELGSDDFLYINTETEEFIEIESYEEE